MINIHASCLVYQNHGILLTGPSGSGKSDLTLRMIRNKGAVLVADDRVDLEARQGELYASVPATIAGLLEVRDLGVLPFSYQKECRIDLVAELLPLPQKPERMPLPDNVEFEGICRPRIYLSAFEESATDKLLLALESMPR